MFAEHADLDLSRFREYDFDRRAAIYISFRIKFEKSLLFVFRGQRVFMMKFKFDFLPIRSFVAQPFFVILIEIVYPFLSDE